MLRCTRPLLAEVAAPGGALGGLGAAAAAAGVVGGGAARGAATDREQRGGRRGAGARVRPLGERYDHAGYPRKSLNIKYSSLVVGQHFATAVVDKRTQLMALLSACNLIREVIAQEGRILITCKDPRLEGELLAAARDCGEFTHFGKWPPGGFTNRPQVMVVPRLPALVISMEHDNHVLMREAFQMCIPRVAPVDVYNNKADATPEVPLQATQLSLAEKKRMLTFFSSFIAKLKYGQMPVGDTQSRFKEYVNAALRTYQQSARDVPAPYVKAASRLYDERPDLKYGLDPKHSEYNEKRAFEESAQYRVAALQQSTYRDAAETEDDVMADKPPSIEDWDINDVVEYTDLSEPYVHTPDNDGAGYVHEVMEDGSLRRVGAEAGQRDYEQEEATALAMAARDSGSVLQATGEQHTSRPSQQEVARSMVAMQMRMERSSVPEVRAEYEAWLKQRQDEANDLMPLSQQTEPEISKSTWSTPGEQQVQARLFRLKNRMREIHAGRKKEEQAAVVPAVTDAVAADAAAAASGRPKPKRRLLRPRRTASGLENTPFDPTAGTDQSVFAGQTAQQLYDSRRTGLERREFQEHVGDLWNDELDNTVDGWNNLPIVPLKEKDRENIGNITPGMGRRSGSGNSGSNGPLGESRRGFSTSTRRLAKGAPISQPVAAPKAASSTGGNGQAKPAFSFPRWLLPAFLFAPAAAYMATVNHADESERAVVREKQVEALHGAMAKLGLAEPLSPARRAALTSELASKESSLSLLLQAHGVLLESVPPSDRHNHKLIFDEMKQTQHELENAIADIKKQLA